VRIAIVGSRNYPALDEVAEYVASLPPDTIVVSGGADGVDTAAYNAARAVGLETVTFVPNYARWPGRQAPLERNKLIAADCDRMVAFWDGKSTGTNHVMHCARALGKPVEVRGPGGAK